MCDFLDWKYVNEEQMVELENATEEDIIKRKMSEIFHLDNYPMEQQIILLRFHLYNYAFCKENGFNYRATSTFLSIMSEQLKRDISLTSSENNIYKSADFFEATLLKHSVERSPKSIKVFEKEQVGLIYDYAMKRYFKNFKLYWYSLGTLSQVKIEQTIRNDIEIPYYVPFSHRCNN